MLELAAAIGGVGTLGALVAVVVLAFRLADVSQRCGDVRVALTAATAELATSRAETKTQSLRADNERRRADALDKLLEEFSPGDAASARARLLAEWIDRAKLSPGTTSGNGGGSMSTDESAPAAKPSDLLKPGE